MRTHKILSALLVSSLLLVPVLSQATGTISGQMMFMLKTAGEPLSVSQMQAAPVYSEFQTELESSMTDGAKALSLIRNFDQQIAQTDVGSVIIEAVYKAVDPQNRRENVGHIFEFYSLEGNEWMLPLVQYSAGDESDEEPIYVTVNRELRDGQPDSEKVTAWTNSMREGMWHLPRVETVSFRGTRLAEDRIERYYPLNQKASDAAFVSTSLQPSTAFKFADPSVSGDGADGKVAVVFVIIGKSGRPVSFFAHMHEHEQEILFANGTPLVTLAKTEVFQDAQLGQTVIILQQEQ